MDLRRWNACPSATHAKAALADTYLVGPSYTGVLNVDKEPSLFYPGPLFNALDHPSDTHHSRFRVIEQANSPVFSVPNYQTHDNTLITHRYRVNVLTNPFLYTICVQDWPTRPSICNNARFISSMSSVPHEEKNHTHPSSQPRQHLHE